MHTLHTLLSILLVGFVTASNLDPCPPPFVELGEGCYYFSDKDTSWDAARKRCNNMNTSASIDLAVFDILPDDFKHVARHAATMRVRGPREYWLGGYKGNDGWYWVDGRPMDLTTSYYVNTEPQGDRQLMMMEFEEIVPRWRCAGYEGVFALFWVCQLKR